jgi:hypothetical protein
MNAQCAHDTFTCVEDSFGVHLHTLVEDTLSALP